MALNSYGADNFQLENDYTIRLDSIEVGQPEIIISCDLSSGDPVDIKIERWKRYVQIEEASFSYVGMDYSTAKSCGDAMRTKFTYNNYQPWVYKDYLEGSKFTRGWHQTSAYLPQLESTVNLFKRGNGSMYDVKVNARLRLEKYSLNNYPSMSDRPLYNSLTSLAGWNSDTGGWSEGKAISAAGADNIALVTAPSYIDNWEVAGEDVVTINANNISGISIDDWYKVTTTYTAAVKYEGMTLAACRNLYNSLNSQSTGWYMSSHPWTLSSYQTGNTWHVEWIEDPNTTVYQCLNRATMHRNGGKMWTIELQLEAQKSIMQKSGSTITHSWPSVWSRVPGMSKFL